MILNKELRFAKLISRFYLTSIDLFIPSVTY